MFLVNIILRTVEKTGLNVSFDALFTQAREQNLRFVDLGAKKSTWQ